MFTQGDLNRFGWGELIILINLNLQVPPELVDKFALSVVGPHCFDTDLKTGVKTLKLYSLVPNGKTIGNVIHCTLKPRLITHKFDNVPLNTNNVTFR